MNLEEENLLVRQASAGDENAYEQLVNFHKHFIFSVIIGIIKNKEDAEEVTMDTFIKAYRKLSTFSFKSKFSTWLYTIAYRQALMFLRKNRHLYDQINDEHKDHFQNTDQQIHQNDQRVIIDRALNKLSAADKTIVSLFYLHELTLEEIEEITNMKAGTIKVRIHRLRKKLAIILTKQLPKLELKNIY